MNSLQAVVMTRRMAMRTRDPRALKNVIIELDKCGGTTAELLEHTMNCAVTAGDVEVFAWATQKYYRLKH